MSRTIKEIIKSKTNDKKLYFYELEQNLQSLNKYISYLINTSTEIINPKIITIYNNFI